MAALLDLEGQITGRPVHALLGGKHRDSIPLSVSLANPDWAQDRALLDRLHGDGVLLAGDAGRFVTKDGVGSWPAMASGVAAARAVKHACEKGDFSRTTLAVYQDFLDEEGLVDTQREAREDWSDRGSVRDVLAEYPDQMLLLARRYYDEWMVGAGEHPYSLLG